MTTAEVTAEANKPVTIPPAQNINLTVNVNTEKKEGGGGDIFFEGVYYAVEFAAQSVLCFKGPQAQPDIYIPSALGAILLKGLANRSVEHITDIGAVSKKYAEAFSKASTAKKIVWIASKVMLPYALYRLGPHSLLTLWVAYNAATVIGNLEMKDIKVLMGRKDPSTNNNSTKKNRRRP